MKALRRFSFVKDVKPVGPYDRQLSEHLQEAAEEVRKHRSSNLKLKSANAFIDEL